MFRRRALKPSHRLLLEPGGYSVVRYSLTISGARTLNTPKDSGCVSQRPPGPTYSREVSDEKL